MKQHRYNLHVVVNHATVKLTTQLSTIEANKVTRLFCSTAQLMQAYKVTCESSKSTERKFYVTVSNGLEVNAVRLSRIDCFKLSTALHMCTVKESFLQTLPKWRKGGALVVVHRLNCSKADARAAHKRMISVDSTIFLHSSMHRTLRKYNFKATTNLRDSGDIHGGFGK